MTLVGQRIREVLERRRYRELDQLVVELEAIVDDMTKRAHLAHAPKGESGMLKAGQDIGCGDENTNTKDPSPDGPNPFAGLTIGRIVHVCLRLPIAEQPLVERPAIITEVKCFERGIIAAHVFMSPGDPPGEIIVHGPGDAAGKPLGAELPYLDHPRQPHEPWTWHWPERGRPRVLHVASDITDEQIADFKRAWEDMLAKEGLTP